MSALTIQVCITACAMGSNHNPAQSGFFHKGSTLPSLVLGWERDYIHTSHDKCPSGTSTSGEGRCPGCKDHMPPCMTAPRPQHRFIRSGPALRTCLPTRSTHRKQAHTTAKPSSACVRPGPGLTSWCSLGLVCEGSSRTCTPSASSPALSNTAQQGGTPSVFVSAGDNTVWVRMVRHPQ